MNPYFLILYALSVLLEGWTPSSLLSVGLSIVKYVRLFISMFIPEPKGTVESRRGFIRITYYSDDGEGMEKKYVLLPTGGPEKTWNRVEAVYRIAYREFMSQQEESNRNSAPNPQSKGKQIDSGATVEKAIGHLDETAVVGTPLSSTSPEQGPILQTEKKDDGDDDMLAEIDSIASGSNSSAHPRRKRNDPPQKLTAAHKYRSCPKVDVTSDILLLAGPNKDFFRVQLTPRDLDSSYQALIFHYGKHQKTFDTTDIIAFP
jgi:hypothetical protein